MKPVRNLLARHCGPGICVIDPFSGKSELGTLRNDINPDSSAHSHIDAVEFLSDLALQGIKADVLLVDPPYSPRQMKECYSRPGLGRLSCSTAVLMAQLKLLATKIVKPFGTTITFGWNSNGMGKPFVKREILLIAHGGAHNDTICVVETLDPSKSMPSEIP